MKCRVWNSLKAKLLYILPTYLAVKAMHVSVRQVFKHFCFITFFNTINYHVKQLLSLFLKIKML